MKWPKVKRLRVGRGPRPDHGAAANDGVRDVHPFFSFVAWHLGFPVVEGAQLIGIVTNRDLRFGGTSGRASAHHHDAA